MKWFSYFLDQELVINAFLEELFQNYFDALLLNAKQMF